MTATIEYRDEIFDVRDGMTVRDAILKLGLTPESVLATREKSLITDDEIIQENDRIRLIAVISGG